MKRLAIIAAFLVIAFCLSSMTHPAADIETLEPTEPPTTEAPSPSPLAMPELVPTIEEPVPEEEPATAPPSRYAEIEITDEDIETLARLAWLEARGEPFEGQVAVVEVVLNRILSPSFPDTVDEVVYQRGQFSPAAYIATTTPDAEQYEAVAIAIKGEEPITAADVVYFSTTAQNERVFAVIENHVFCRE